MKNNKPYLSNPLLIGLLCGITGGAALMVIPKLTRIGLLQLSPYLLFVSLSVFLVKNVFRQDGFKDIFYACFVTFMLMSALFILYQFCWINPHSGITAAGVLWRILLISAIGAFVSSLVSLLTKSLHH